MKINLYYAPYPCQTFRGEEEPISTVRVNNPKSALVTLASGARKYLQIWGLNAEVEIIDTQVDKGKRYYKSFDYGPQILDCYRVGGEFESYDSKIKEASIHGISNNYTNSTGIVFDFAKYIKSVNPNAFLVAGGLDATARPEFYIENGFDAVVMLEGEHSFARIIESKIKNTEMDKHLVCRKHGHGVIIEGGELLNMDELPMMALDLVKNIDIYTDTGEGTPPNTVHTPYTCFETSRGCYRSCSFCATPMRGRYRYMSPAAVKKHFDYFKAVGVNNLLFQEDNILSRIQRSGRGALIHSTGRAEVIEIFRMARDYGFSWEFANGLEFGKFLDTGTIDYELMEALFWNDQTGNRWKGCYRVQIPLEFLGEDPAKKFNKLRSFEDEIQILEAVLDLGINYQTFNVIIGHERDDENAIETYLDRCMRLKDALFSKSKTVVPYFNIFNRTLLPGTRDFINQKHKLAFDINQNPEVISVYLSPMNTEFMDYYDLTKSRIRMTSELNGDLIDQYDGIFHKKVQLKLVEKAS